MREIDPEVAARLATEIVVAYLGRRDVEPERLADIVRSVRLALREDLAQAEAMLREGLQLEPSASDSAPPRNGPEPAPPSAQDPERIAQSIFPDYLVSFEDGNHYRTLKRHLMAKYGMTPDDYRRKWGLPHDYPMVAPNYAKERSQVAIRSGLGRRVAPSHAQAGTPSGE
ncbi:MAG: MucR family transcriptional regulator [Phenylobacterium sp.]|jgi:predicted transcriptional regulator